MLNVTLANPSDALPVISSAVEKSGDECDVLLPDSQISPFRPAFGGPPVEMTNSENESSFATEYQPHHIENPMAYFLDLKLMM